MNVMNQNRVSILVVEDDTGHVQLIRRAFEQHPGVRLTVAGTLDEARRILTDSVPDLAIVDLLLPDGRGIDLLRERMNEAALAFPAVIMTGHGDEGVAVEAMKAGALDYLVKSGDTLAQLPHFAARALREWHHITQRRLAEKKLMETNRELEAFVYTISHDLRSPLTPILSYAEFLREEYGPLLDSRAVDALAEIERQGYRMITFLEDLLDLARAGHLERPDRPVNTARVIRDVMRELDYQGKGATVGVREPLPFVHMPKTLLGQLFRNLIGNAVSHAGGAEIEVGGERRQDGLISFFVRDRGPGIPPEERDRIFDLFYRGTHSGGRPGTGIGLAMVRKITSSYGGRAWVEETPGGGSTFRIEFRDDAVHPGEQREKHAVEKTFYLEIYGDYCELPL
jgi:signal transduction histidine kinase